MPLPRPTVGQFQVLLFRLVSLLSLNAGRWLGRQIGRLFYLVPNYNRNNAIANIRHCFPHLSEKEQKQLVAQSLQHTGMTAAEMAMIWFKPWCWLEQKIVAVEGWEIYQQALAKNKGVILLAPHQGNWEVIGQYVAQHASIMNMYEPPARPELDQLLQQSRCRTGALLAPANQRGLVQLLKHLKAGHTVGLLPDQVPDDRKRSAVIAPFFGQPAHTMTLLHQMLKKTGCGCVAVVAERVAEGFVLRFSQVPEDLFADDTITSATALNRCVQELVERAPAQYQWEYKRFKGLPKQEKRIY